jgi:mannose-6-phosphate isomerase-like protein (cupin superfamily)
MSAMSDYTILNLDEIDDSATGRGLEFGSARFPRDAVGAQSTGFAHITLRPGRHQPFGHRHKEAEEVYFVISGSGAIKLDDGVHQLRARDIVRLAPHVTRSLEGGPDGMELIVFGARHAGDGEMIDGYWEH